MSCFMFSYMSRWYRYRPGRKHIAEFHDAISSSSVNILRQDDLSLFVDYSTCIAEGQHSAFYKYLVPSWVNATKSTIL